ncbi:MAG: (deoxy)nucleoside triphosphate pyrophosphohydrolase [Candidatus Polarisedimenticolia bacterium]
MTPLLLVVAAVVIRDGRVLLARRPGGVHLEGHWEFPGGKVEPGEAPHDALVREIHEELGVGASVLGPFAFNDHAYDDRHVLLLTYLVTLEDEPRPLGCAELGWFTAGQVAALRTPPADVPIFAKLAQLLAP